MRPTEKQLKMVGQIIFGQDVASGHIWKAIGEHFGKDAAWANRWVSQEQVKKMIDEKNREIVTASLAQLSLDAIAVARDEYGATTDEVVELVMSGPASELWSDWNIDMEDDVFASELRERATN